MGMAPTRHMPESRALSHGERAGAQRRGEGGRGERELKGVSEPVRVFSVRSES
jgi:hypothetical protein